MADDLAAQLAQAEYEHWAHDHHDPTPWEDLPDTYREAWTTDTRRTLAWLAEHGRLIPDGAEVRTEWTMRYRVNGRPQHGADDAGHVFDSREQAQLHLQVWRDLFPTCTYTDVEYLRHTVITTPWTTQEPT